MNLIVRREREGAEALERNKILGLPPRPDAPADRPGLLLGRARRPVGTAQLCG
ncbi:hypothetical protein HerbRD11066_24030 [Herbidospora sp. RD11066]